MSTLQIDCVWPKLTELDKTPEHGHQSCITYLLHDAKAKFGQLLDTARREPVVIERHGRAVAVVLSKEDFDELNALKLERLCTEIAAEVVAVEAGEYTDYDEENLMQLGERIKAEGRKTHSAK